MQLGRLVEQALADKADAYVREIYEELQGAEVAFGQVLEASPARGDRVVGSIETFDDSQQVLGVLAQFQLYRAAERRVAGKRQRCLGPVAVRLDERAEAEPLEPLSHRAPIPSERSGGCLHVEPVLAEGGENRRVATRLLPAGLTGLQPQVFDRDNGAVGEHQGLAQAVLKLACVARPVASLERGQRGLG